LQVEIDGIAPELLYAGAHQFEGLFQINARVPMTARTGVAVPVRVTINGVTAEGALAVAP
jgi:uncharacterized protein (TIGR03437 family)